jgi:hypothetical protein
MIHAQCCCGAIRLQLSDVPISIVACHCIDCQRRTGAPFGAGAFYPAEAVAITGVAKEFTREAASGGMVHTYFCPNCGSSVYWTADNLPSMIGVAIGALAGLRSSVPAISIFERSKHAWLQMAGVAKHFQDGSLVKNSG